MTPAHRRLFLGGILAGLLIDPALFYAYFLRDIPRRTP